MKEYNRRHPTRDIIRHDARTRPLKPARWEDSGRYFRCWNCGFVCDSWRDELGGSDDRAGTGEELSPITIDLPGPTYSIDINEAQGKLVIQGIAVLERPDITADIIIDENGEPAVDENGEVALGSDNLYLWTPLISRGCPLCGTLNYDGRTF